MKTITIEGQEFELVEHIRGGTVLGYLLRPLSRVEPKQWAIGINGCKLLGAPGNIRQYVDEEYFFDNKEQMQAVASAMKSLLEYINTDRDITYDTTKLLSYQNVAQGARKIVGG
jgi:hypothetical protein